MELPSRLCKKCGLTKPLEEFVKNKNKLYGRSYECKLCLAARVRELWSKNRNRYNEIIRERYWKNRDKNLKKNRSRDKKYKRKPKDPLKEKVRDIAKYAIKTGHLVRLPCEVCGEPRSQGHHDDYNKPLDVRWLCRMHHAEWHRNNKPIEALTPPKGK